MRGYLITLALKAAFQTKVNTHYTAHQCITVGLAHNRIIIIMHECAHATPLFNKQLLQTFRLVCSCEYLPSLYQELDNFLLGAFNGPHEWSATVHSLGIHHCSRVQQQLHKTLLQVGGGRASSMERRVGAT